MGEQDELAAVIADTFRDWGQGRDTDLAPVIAAAVRSFMGSQEVVERAVAAAIPEPTHLYVGRVEADVLRLQAATGVDRLAFKCRYLDALSAAIGEDIGGG